VRVRTFQGCRVGLGGERRNKQNRFLAKAWIPYSSLDLNGKKLVLAYQAKQERLNHFIFHQRVLRDVRVQGNLGDPELIVLSSSEEDDRDKEGEKLNNRYNFQ